MTRGKGKTEYFVYCKLVHLYICTYNVLSGCTSFQYHRATILQVHILADVENSGFSRF